MNKDNVIIQKAGLVATDSKSFHILIGTKDLDREQYTIQVSTNKSFTPMGFSQFTVKGDLPFLIPLLVVGLGSNPDDVDGKIVKVKFKTMMDKRVDEACKKYENKIYNVKDKNMPQIPIHFNCRCHYEILEIE